MQLYAVDGATDAMTGTAMVTVLVSDVNDNRPRFSKPLYDVFVMENTPPGTMVVTLEAFDADDGDNGVIDFQFAVSTLESESSQVFSVNSSTGQIVVKVTTLASHSSRISQYPPPHLSVFCSVHPMSYSCH